MSPIETVQTCQLAASEKRIDELLALSDPDILLLGPRGSGRGHQLLREWVGRAGIDLQTLRVIDKGNVVIVEQHAVWRAPETGEVMGESDIASRFVVSNGVVTEYARFDTLEEAMG